MTTTWTGEELDRIGDAQEVELAAQRPDGSLDRYTTVWVVRVGDDVYVRSWRGARGGWYRRALQTHLGRIRVSGTEREVTFTQLSDAPHGDIDRGYRTKYARYDPTYVQPMTAGPATAATLQLHPR